MRVETELPHARNYPPYLTILYCLQSVGPPPEKKRKETLLSAELGKFLEKKVRVKFQGGREGEWYSCIGGCRPGLLSSVATTLLSSVPCPRGLVADGKLSHGGPCP